VRPTLSALDRAAPTFPAPIGAGSRIPPPLSGVPARSDQVDRLRHGDEFDVLVVGGGSVGAGVALDAQTRGLSVACIERGDFASETSSRSTKLLWAGIRYLATAAAGLLRTTNFSRPLEALEDFRAEIAMVLNCHRERRYMIEQQPHLCHWIPIALPFTSLKVDPPPFGHPLFGFFPVLAPLVFKVYDAMSSFSCPPSYVMGPRAAREKFPQLSRESSGIKFVQVFYEAMHDDARTNLAIALTAASKGAAIANYCEAAGFLSEDGRVVGANVVDRVAGDAFEVRAKAVVFCGGPFTDALRNLEAAAVSDDPPAPAVRGASGTHVVLPGYYCPRDMGLLDYNTSDGRFLFFLPWLGHALVGTTDSPGAAEARPTPPEDEVQWLLNECAKYLSLDIRVSRSDVLSAWRGWRPLATDPRSAEDGGAPASRDHVVSYHAATGVTFCAGGKWTTWREMAEDVVDVVVENAALRAAPCKTPTLPLHGHDGYQKTLPVMLMQRGGVSPSVGEHLAKTYGGRAWDVLALAKPTGKASRRRRRTRSLSLGEIYETRVVRAAFRGVGRRPRRPRRSSYSRPLRAYGVGTTRVIALAYANAAASSSRRRRAARRSRARREPWPASLIR